MGGGFGFKSQGLVVWLLDVMCGAEGPLSRKQRRLLHVMHFISCVYLVREGTVGCAFVDSV